MEEIPEHLDDKQEFWKKEKKDEKKENKKDEIDENINEADEIFFGKTPSSGEIMNIVSKTPPKPFKKILMELPKPVSYSPSANTPAARKAVRHVFAALLRHHGALKWLDYGTLHLH